MFAFESGKTPHLTKCNCRGATDVDTVALCLSKHTHPSQPSAGYCFHEIPLFVILDIFRVCYFSDFLLSAFLLFGNLPELESRSQLVCKFPR